MLIHVHKNATTTPATLQAIQQAHGTEAEMAKRSDVGKFTIRKWSKRSTVEDGSHTPHRPQTTLSNGQEEFVVYLRTHLRAVDGLSAGGGARVHRACHLPLGAGPLAAPALREPPARARGRKHTDQDLQGR